MPAEHWRPSAERRPDHAVVLVFGLRPERLLDSEGRIDAFLEPPGQEQVGVLVEAVKSGLDEGGSVIAIAPDWIGPEPIGRVAMVRSMLDTHRLAVYETALPPLAATVLASLASACAPYAPSPACSRRCCPSSRPSCTSSRGWRASPGSRRRRRASASTSHR